ncbi:Protein FANTASTIC FOUR like [Quillaja saponaria]|uniref:Protein FANTASTIC FOUR like n=1 Tax=Quillaja saponaria TaxID=32244 RepID=A0AAD7Q2H7_QUISA|nr:Protein FANTASTIC FOUR like [Quillaja saponaria]
MMSFCPTNSSTTTTTENFSFQSHHNQKHRQYIVSVVGGGGLGLIIATGDIQKPSNILESTTVKPTPPSSPRVKKDPGGIGFIEDIGGGVDGLMSCTETLGFESPDERRIDDQIEEINNENFDQNGTGNSCGRTTKTAEAKSAKWRDQVKKFPQPISSLNQNGKPSFFLHPVRKDGRLELTEVRIHRPEILLASRQDGRLRLQLISEDQDIIEGEEEEAEEEEVDEQEVEEKLEEERNGEFWKFPAVNGDGLMRCHELVNHHHHRYNNRNHHHHNQQHLHVWSEPHCVTIR